MQSAELRKYSTAILHCVLMAVRDESIIRFLSEENGPGEHIRLNVIDESLPTQPQKEREPNSADQDQSTNRHCTEKIVTIVVSFVLFCIVITCTVFSKVSFISLASCFIIRSNNTTIHENGTGRGYDEVVGWQLLFIVLVPQFVTFFCTLFCGVCGKKCIVSSWPTILKVR